VGLQADSRTPDDDGKKVNSQQEYLEIPVSGLLIILWQCDLDFVEVKPVSICDRILILSYFALEIAATDVRLRIDVGDLFCFPDQHGD